MGFLAFGNSYGVVIGFLDSDSSEFKSYSTVTVITVGVLASKFKMEVR